MLLPMMDKKKIVSIVLGEKPVEKKVPEGLESDFSPALEASAGDMLSAFESKDAKKLASALKEFVMMCEKEEDYQEESSEEME
jgi:hypothetical protein